LPLYSCCAISKAQRIYCSVFIGSTSLKFLALYEACCLKASSVFLLFVDRLSSVHRTGRLIVC
jgi:hypothetical protein